jgi:hypothetical protein
MNCIDKKGEIAESQQKNSAGLSNDDTTVSESGFNQSTTCQTTVTSDSITTNANGGLTNEQHPSIKLNKEELKLSPIRKKSLSSSSLIDDLDPKAASTTAVIAMAPLDEENKENTSATATCAADNADSDSAAGDKHVEGENNVNTTGTTNNNGTSDQQKLKNQIKKTFKASNLISKFIADCVNKKLKKHNQLMKTNGDNKTKSSQGTISKASLHKGSTQI